MNEYVRKIGIGNPLDQEEFVERDIKVDSDHVNVVAYDAETTEADSLTKKIHDLETDIPDPATAENAGIVKPGNGLQMAEGLNDGTIELAYDHTLTLTDGSGTSIGTYDGSEDKTISVATVPTYHASANTTYGVGDSNKYGHLKITNTYNDASAAAADVALSSTGANNLYQEFNAKIPQGGLVYRGSVVFANIPSSDVKVGDMYNIEDDFTTDSRFLEGTGIKAKAGTNIAWNGTKWDLLAVGGSDADSAMSTTSTNALQNKVITSALANGNIRFGIDSQGKYGYIKAGADTVIPFKGDPVLQSKTVSPTTSSQTVQPDTNYDGLSQVTVNAIATQTKSVNPTTSTQTVTPDSGKYLSSVSVGAISTQTKTATLTGSQHSVIPDSGKYLSSVTIPAVVGTATAASVLSSATFSSTSNPTGATGSIATRSASSEIISAAKTYSAGYYPSGWTVTPGNIMPSLEYIEANRFLWGTERSIYASIFGPRKIGTFLLIVQVLYPELNGGDYQVSSQDPPYNISTSNVADWITDLTILYQPIYPGSAAIGILSYKTTSDSSYRAFDVYCNNLWNVDGKCVNYIILQVA